MFGPILCLDCGEISVFVVSRDDLFFDWVIYHWCPFIWPQSEEYSRSVQHADVLLIIVLIVLQGNLVILFSRPRKPDACSGARD